ncbi:hypothetical protein DL991_00800 [Amycolatopsis sp. WAC 01375]|nr:hypothetical protein DL991_00800 [Amycolatopsis sp. WAC 01375]
MDFMRPQVEEIRDLAAKAGPDTFSLKAQQVLLSDDRRDKAIFSAGARQPFIVATDAASAARLPNLVPDTWLPYFTELVLRAVDDED